MTLSCSNCGKELPDDARFCSDCGTTVATQASTQQKTNYCSFCGYELPEDAKFCLHCGRPVVEVPAKRKRDESIRDELYASSPYRADPSVVRDFDHSMSEVISRAERWAAYQTSNFNPEDWYSCLRDPTSYEVFADFNWMLESSWFPTNNPNAQKALFLRVWTKWFIREARKRGFIDYLGNFGEQVFAYYKKEHRWTDEDLANLRFEEPDYTKFDELRKKDDELFPPPQPLRVEVAGTILNFTTDEGALVVYVDCAYKGKTIEIFKFSEAFISSDYPDRKAEIIERTIDNTVICAAVFNHVPFVTDQHRYNRQVLKQMDCTVSSLIPARYEDRWVETVTLFRGNVAELDWRGRKA